MQLLEIWKQVCRPLAAGLLAGLAVLLLPLLTLAGEPESEPPQTGAPQLLPPAPASTPSAPAVDADWDGTRTVRVLEKDGSVVSMTVADYLWRVVAAEMPATFEPEALRAQAVCARTYTLWKGASGRHDGADLCADSACCQAYVTPEDAAARWGAQAEDYAARIAAAVSDTNGQIVTCGGQPIMAVFFSSSAESTEDAAAVWGESVSYLVPVNSPEGEEVPNYRSTVTLTAEELAAAVKAAYPDAVLSGDASGWIGAAAYTASGRVDTLELGGLTLSGGAARALFGLRSACFTVTEEGGVFTFSVTGYGHGVGMSQYGANAMAAEGRTWQEIITHYYTGVEITAAE